jgi:hypothetical protein
MSEMKRRGMSEPERFIVIKPDNLEVAIGPDRQIVIRLRGLEDEAGLTPGLGVMIGLTATEARQFADALRNTANRAEEGLPRA